ncbi:flavin reductase family protein [Amycolatopsis jejuensis]|uniref:flavin reductase family protein n=1 Tax=Amycolatopsis jejuensis TaxID=330084 RepID=UPI0006906E6D|nr:flavin reductase family protein [Amycolatopsis jejuensis]
MPASLARYEGNAAELRRVYSSFPSGIVALLARVEGEPQGMVAASFTVGVSMDPPLVSCAVQRVSATWPVLKSAAVIGVSVLAADHGGLARRLGAADRAERFTEVPLRSAGTSALFVAGAPAWFECAVAGEFPAGDHTVALLEVLRCGADPRPDPLVFHGSSFRRLRPAGDRPAPAEEA